jgi:esterase
VRLHVEAAGAPDAPAVVFLHGVSGSAATYGWLPDEITAGRRIVRIDLRGHGRSQHAPGTYAVPQYTDDVAEALRAEIGRPAVLVGHSLGGVVAWTLAQRHPDLLVAAFLEDPPLYMGESEEHERNAAVPMFAQILDAVARWRAEGASEDEVAGELAAGPLAARNAEGAIEARAEALLQMDPGVLEGAVDRSTLADTDTSSPVGVPVTILAADDALSAFPERHEQRLARSHPDVRVVRVAGASHGIHQERDHRADYVRELARFLAAHA